MHTLKLFISMPPKSFSSEVVPANEIEALKNAFDRTITEKYIGPIMNLLEKLYNSPQSKS